MPKKDPAKLTKVSLSLPFGIGKVDWESDPTERKAAWALYVELVTRVAVQEIDGGGLFSEALASLYSIFESTRAILREGGPNLGARRDSVGGIAIAVLNQGIRPFLSKWHAPLLSWHATREPSVSLWAHENHWPEAGAIKNDIATLRKELGTYAQVLATIAGVEES